MNTALITGANRGLGLAFATSCLERGDTVFAGCRDPSRAAALPPLAARFPGHLHVLQLGVTGPAQRHAAIGVIQEGIVTLLVNPGWMQTGMGGEKADLSPQDAARSILDFVARSDASHAAGFFDWNGQPHPW